MAQNNSRTAYLLDQIRRGNPVNVENGNIRPAGSTPTTDQGFQVKPHKWGLA